MKNKKVYIKNIRNSNIEIEFLSKWLLNLEDNLKILGIKRDLIFKDLLQNIVDSNYHKECINNSDTIHTKKYNNTDTINTEHSRNEIEALKLC